MQTAWDRTSRAIATGQLPWTRSVNWSRSGDRVLGNLLASSISERADFASRRHNPLNVLTRPTDERVEAQEPSYDVSRLLAMSKTDLDDLFRRSPAGDIPSGQGTGTAIISPGTKLSRAAAGFVRAVAWHGKVFDPASGTLKNRIRPIPVQP